MITLILHLVSTAIQNTFSYANIVKTEMLKL
jgi:hypothetical protein